MAGISNLSGGFSDSIRWTASNDITGQQPLTQGDQIGTNYNFGTNLENDESGGADEVVSFLQAIAPSGTATINLKSILNILQQAGVALARLKGYKIRLLAASGNGAVDTTNGTACSSITVGGAGSDPNLLEMEDVSDKYRIKSGGTHQHFDPSAGGFVEVTNTTKNILITNNDASVAAAVQLSLVGCTT